MAHGSPEDASGRLFLRRPHQAVQQAVGQAPGLVALSEDRLVAGLLVVGPFRRRERGRNRVGHPLLFADFLLRQAGPGHRQQRQQSESGRKMPRFEHPSILADRAGGGRLLTFLAGDPINRSAVGPPAPLADARGAGPPEAEPEQSR